MKMAFAGVMLAVAMLGATVASAGDDPRGQRQTRLEWKAPFADMSPQGAAIIAGAMQAQRIPSNAEEVRKARQKVLDLISAERLDIEAIRRAQAEERALAIKCLPQRELAAAQGDAQRLASLEALALMPG